MYPEFCISIDRNMVPVATIRVGESGWAAREEEAREVLSRLNAAFPESEGYRVRLARRTAATEWLA